MMPRKVGLEIAVLYELYGQQRHQRRDCDEPPA
jgi:hypothetical protein